ncbi:EVA1C-like protein [Mya arenaria]|uniref:EVA1C-like protein n=1 Tax=Mya arenaria TaxID=6604 RepID=A0ABY7EFL3_MYAAR|nr:EVA1C-like protein [Mya arenaria]WAR07293.1 EVA1C-like protein [Mya arenaria]
MSCDGESMKMSCPPGLLVSIQFAQYGRQVPSSRMCPSNVQNDDPGIGRRGGTGAVLEDTNCMATTSLKVILDACQDRQSCSLVASTKTFEQDPCPGTRKYLEVAYKCRPNEFSSETVCEGDQLELRCSRSTRIAISTGMFGRASVGDLKCPELLRNTSAIQTTCRSKTAVSELKQICHGRKSCTIYAEEYVFGNPCPKGVNKYLNVVYTCVPKQVLKSNRKHKKKDGDAATSENNDIQRHPSDRYPGDPVIGKSKDTHGDKHGGKFEDSLSRGSNLEPENKEKALLYLVLGVAFGVISLLFLVIIRLAIINKRKSRAKLDVSEPVHENHTIPSNHIEVPTLDRTDSLDRIEVVRFNPMHSRDFATCTLRSDIGDRSLTNYYG